MKRSYAAAVLAVLAAAGLFLTARKDEGPPPVVGSWEAGVEFSVGDAAATPVRGFVRYTFRPDGVYTLTAAKERAELENGAQRQGRYSAREGRLCFSEGLDYEPDGESYELYSLEGDVLVIDRGTAGALVELYPLRLTKVPED